MPRSMAMWIRFSWPGRRFDVPNEMSEISKPVRPSHVVPLDFARRLEVAAERWSGEGQGGGRGA